MRLTVPITGTVLVEGPLSTLVGDENDPVRLIPINLGNVSWVAVSVDLKNEVMEIEVSPAEHIAEDTGEVDERDEPIYTLRPTTEQEKTALLDYAKDLVMDNTKDELFAMTKSPRLKRPFKEKK